MGQIKQAKGLESLSRATDTLSTLLAQEVRELNARKKAQNNPGGADGPTTNGLTAPTAVLKDLAAVAKTLNDQGTQTEGTGCGVVILPPVEEET